MLDPAAVYLFLISCFQHCYQFASNVFRRSLAGKLKDISILLTLAQKRANSHACKYCYSEQNCQAYLLQKIIEWFCLKGLVTYSVKKLKAANQNSMSESHSWEKNKCF